LRQNEVPRILYLYIKAAIGRLITIYIGEVTRKK
jgi:hypothetical protein